MLGFRIVTADWEKHLDEVTINVLLYLSNVYFVSMFIRRINENYMNMYNEFFSKSPESFVEIVGKWYDAQVSSVQSYLS